MALRSIANATIAFGLVSIPVRVHSATESADDIKFTMLHAGCGSRLKQRYECDAEKVAVERDQVVKGFEVQKDQFVTFTPAELEQLELESTQTIAIAEFCDWHDVPGAFYFERSYLLSPDKGAERPYQLMARVLENGTTAIARYAARGKLYLVILTAIEGRLVMVQLHYASEIRSVSNVWLPPIELRAEEIELAEKLARKLRRRGKLDLAKYRDEAKERIRSQIQRKLDGEEITAAASDSRPAPIPDLLEALRLSVKDVKRGSAARRPSKASA